jgi:hypothetical protein
MGNRGCIALPMMTNDGLALDGINSVIAKDGLPMQHLPMVN